MNMAEKLGLGPEVRELNLGASFTSKAVFHTIRYDFKPASVDTSKMATVDVGGNQSVTVNVPNLNGSGTEQTVFRGCRKQYAKECVLIIDQDTGEIRLERLSTNIQLKKTRDEGSGRIRPPPRPVTPVDGPITKRTSPQQKFSPSHSQKSSPSHLPSQKSLPSHLPNQKLSPSHLPSQKASPSHLSNRPSHSPTSTRNSPMHVSPNRRTPSYKLSPSHNSRSPSNQKRSPNHVTKSPTMTNSQKSLLVPTQNLGPGSMPVIGSEDDLGPVPMQVQVDGNHEIGVLSDSSSDSDSSSGSGSGSDSESGTELTRSSKHHVKTASNGHRGGAANMHHWQDEGSSASQQQQQQAVPGKQQLHTWNDMVTREERMLCNLAGARSVSLKIISIVEEQLGHDVTKGTLVKQYRRKVEQELQEMHQKIRMLRDEREILLDQTQELRKYWHDPGYQVNELMYPVEVM